MIYCFPGRHLVCYQILQCMLQDTATATLTLWWASFSKHPTRLRHQWLSKSSGCTSVLWMDGQANGSDLIPRAGLTFLLLEPLRPLLTSVRGALPVRLCLVRAEGNCHVLSGLLGIVRVKFLQTCVKSCCSVENMVSSSATA